MKHLGAVDGGTGVMGDRPLNDRSLGIYLHVPFCLKKCRYCNFYSTTDLSQEEAFTSAILKELDLVPSGSKVDTVYWGGGTPSLLSIRSMTRIFEKLSERFLIDSDAEITLEANPLTLDREKLRFYRKVGINRLNIGVQSFSDRLLYFLGRVHSSKEASSTIEAARREGFDHLGMDLIFGIPGQDRDDLFHDLQRAVSFDPEHLSCYLLTVEEKTPLGKAKVSGNFISLPDRVEALFFEAIQTFLTERGYFQYEISNYARISDGGGRDLRSRHNLKYWNFEYYRGLGPSAHSFMGDRRFWNHGNLFRYIFDLKEGKLPLEGAETLTVEQQIIESVYLGLRKTEGVSVVHFENLFGIDLMERSRDFIETLRKEGFLEYAPPFLRLTAKGLRFADGIASQILAIL